MNSKYIFTILFSLTIGVTSAHKDFFVQRLFGNVEVSIKTGFKYEEIQKVLMIGKLAENLLKEINYTDHVLLDFEHDYTRSCNPHQFISYDDGTLTYNQMKRTQKIVKDRKLIVVRQLGTTFDVVTSLKLLEYAVTNLSDIEIKQKSLVFKDQFNDWTLNSIDSVEIVNQLNKPISKKLEMVLNCIILRPQTEKLDSVKQRITYYYKYNKFFIIQIDGDTLEQPLLEIENIYDFRRINESSAIVYDTDHSFYYINSNNKKVSKRQVVNGLNIFYRPYELRILDNNNLAMIFDSYLGLKMIFYNISKDCLIEKRKNFNEKDTQTNKID